MKRMLVITTTALSVLGTAGVAAAAPAQPACNGLDVAHEQTHATGSTAELRHHDLRAAHHCGH